MRSTFMGLETVRRGLFTQQSALYTTGHNVANANTPGYSRQRVNFQQTKAFPSIGLDSPYLPGQMGTGVEGGTVQRIRESFLDVQYRGENNKVGYYGALSESLEKMEGIMNEPTTSGLQNTLDLFWKSLQDLTTQTENSGARDVVASRGQMVAETINYYYNTLTQVQGDIGSQVETKVKEVNALLEKIDALNQRIADVEPHGYLPNDLYDERDSLVDELSGLVNIRVSSVIPNEYGQASPLAEGLYNIEIVQQGGNSYVPAISLLSVTKTSGIVGMNQLNLQTDPANGLVTGVQIGNHTITDVSFSGELAGLIKSYGYIETDGSQTGIYPEMLEQLNKIAEVFANEFNEIHKNGYALGSDTPSGLNFFEFTAGNAAQTITVNEDILNNSSLIAAAEEAGGSSGDNNNAKKLADIMKKDFANYITTVPAGLNGSLVSYYSGIIGSLGVQSQSAQKDLTNSITLATSVEINRQSVSSVSLDEEMTNMIKYQQAYNSSARMITVIDETLDKIVNGLGIGGR